jgi:hypothetical protein
LAKPASDSASTQLSGVAVVRGRQDRAVAPVGEGVAAGAQILAQLVVVVDLAVEDDRDGAVEELIGLPAAGEVHDGEPVAAQRPPLAVGGTVAVRTAMALPGGDRPELGREGVRVDVAVDPAHNTHSPTVT